MPRKSARRITSPPQVNDEADEARDAARALALAALIAGELIQRLTPAEADYLAEELRLTDGNIFQNELTIGLA